MSDCPPYVDPCAPAAYSVPPPGLTLAQLNVAIQAVETGAQRYKIMDRELQRGDLRWMYPERARLEKRVFAEQRARRGIRVQRVVPL